MKNKLISLSMIVFYFSIIFAITVPFGKWLILNEVNLQVLIDAAKLGSYIGAYCGFGIWFLYRVVWKY
jgi:hypothetical protein